MKSDTLVKCVLMLAAVVILGMMVKRYNERNNDLEELYNSSDKK